MGDTVPHNCIDKINPKASKVMKDKPIIAGTLTLVELVPAADVAPSSLRVSSLVAAAVPGITGSEGEGATRQVLRWEGSTTPFSPQ